MDEINNNLAGATTGSRRRRPSPQRRAGNTTLITVLVVVGVIGVVVLIGWLGSSGKPTPPATPIAPAPVANDQENEARAADEARAQHVRFNGFASRLAAALGKDQKAVLQSLAARDVAYSCNYIVRRTEVQRSPDSLTPADCLLTLSGDVDANDGDDKTSDTYQITATFNESDGQWKVVKAVSKVLTHKGEIALFGDPIKVGMERDLSVVNWFRAAVAEAQKAP